jgi:hypothetical protein
MRRTAARLAAAVAILCLVGVGLGTAPAQATLSLLQPDGSVPATFVGRGGVSTDGVGTNSGEPAQLQAEVPAGSTVEQAYLYATYTQGNNSPPEVQRTVTFGPAGEAGTSTVLTLLGPDPSNDLATARADVTSIVAGHVGSGGGIFDFDVTEAIPITGVVDGTALVVIYSNPSSKVTTIAVLDGESTFSGDEFSFGFATPLEPNRPGFEATLALGSGFSYQGGTPGHVCTGGQFSIVDVNAQRLSSCAGHYDDGEPADGALITVGGVGDSTDNPADPMSSSDGEDDELYDLVPFLSEGDTEITVNTANPSNDDNLFLAVLSVGQAVGGAVTPPTAVDDSATTGPAQPVDIDVIANDQDPDGVIDPTTLSAATEPANGTAEAVDGIIRYTPAAGFTGTDTFDYEVCGVDFTVCTQATVTVTVGTVAVPVQPTFTG